MDDARDRLRAGLEGRYTIERELGRGGMATVYLAVDVKHHRRVALKLLHPEFAAVVGPERFLREIDIAATLSNPHILPLYDSGQVDGLLYYVMPYVAGESLETRLHREIQLPIEAALAITKDIAAGLTYAHEQGLVHRDIKPGNILLDGESAVLADFGIARAVDVVAGEEVTDSGMVIGTPEYMSPEQGQGHGKIDARSDVYSLGCVLYEMLAGEPPFDGPTAQVIIARHQHEAPRSLTMTRSTVPASVEFAIESALAKVPADRPNTAERFVEMLDETAPVRHSGIAPAENTRLKWIAVAAMIVAILVTWRLWPDQGQVRATATLVSEADTSRYAILPFAYASDVPRGLQEIQLLRDALVRWDGLNVVDPFQVEHVFQQTGLTFDDPAAVARAALGLGAGRYLVGDVTDVAGELRIRVGLHDATSKGAMLDDFVVRVPASTSKLDSVFAQLVDHLLFRGELPANAPILLGTRSLPARQAFSRGQAAVGGWDLETADTAFSESANFDEEYAEAHLWLALVRSWANADNATWILPAEQAALGRDDLSQRDRVMSAAILAQARGEMADACAQWKALSDSYPRDFAVWYGLAWCLSKDNTVVPSTSSPSRWAFRSSLRRALEAYERAFRLHPAVLASFGDNGFADMRRLLRTDLITIRFGVGTESGRQEIFGAYAGWVDDSLTLVPWPAADIMNNTAPPPQGWTEAAQHQRRVFHDIAMTWVSESPANPMAMEALAVSLDMLGNPAALDTLRRARLLAEDAGTKTSLAIAEVWLRLKWALPDNREGIDTVLAMADSLLEVYADINTDVEGLASLAMLTGKPHLAIRHLQHEFKHPRAGVPAALAESSPAFLVYAALGGPADSLGAAEERVVASLELQRGTPTYAGLQQTWLARPVQLAYPDWQSASLSTLRGQGDLIDMQLAHSTGDSRTITAGFEKIGRFRAGLSPAAITVDGVYPEVRLLLALGDTAAAIGGLDRFFETLELTAPGMFLDVPKAGALMRSVVLRAELAEVLGDPEVAELWARCLVRLWQDADPFLQETVGRMKSITQRQLMEKFPAM